MQRARDELNKQREDEIRAIERRKSKHIAALVAAHEKAFADIKLYYNEITHSNLDLIKTLKDEVRARQPHARTRTRRVVCVNAACNADSARVVAPCVWRLQVEVLRSKEALHERNMFSIAQENKKMSEPMRKAIEEVKRLREERTRYQEELQELAETKAHVLVAQVRRRAHAHTHTHARMLTRVCMCTLR